MKLCDSEKELTTQKGIVESFRNTEYKRINDELGALNKELQGLKTGKTRLDTLIQDLRTLVVDYPAYSSGQKMNLNPYEQQVRNIVDTIEKCISDVAVHPSIETAGAREREVSGKVKTLREELDTFLKSRGLSEENLSDVGKATERIAQLEEEIATLKTKVGVLRAELDQFAPQRDTADQYAKSVEALTCASQRGTERPRHGGQTHRNAIPLRPQGV